MITKAIYDRLSSDGTLTAFLNSYEGEVGIFTTDPAPDDAALPYVVTAGEVAQQPRDTKTTRGREVWRDVRCYASPGGSAETVEAIAERVRTLLHRQALEIDGFVWVWAECSGPIVADEQDAYCRIVTVRMVVEEL
ncbi:MAG: DUF3168 domain-containing protein [Anaerolineae bacterium]|nr:DUF3168 domain-containing protein [Anaerolineae bacterium]